MKARVQKHETDKAESLGLATERGRQRQVAGLRATAIRYLAGLNLLLVGFTDECAIALPVLNYTKSKQLSRKDLKEPIGVRQRT